MIESIWAGQGLPRRFDLLGYFDGGYCARDSCGTSEGNILSDFYSSRFERRSRVSSGRIETLKVPLISEVARTVASFSAFLSLKY